jgi:STAM-binding protein
MSIPSNFVEIFETLAEANTERGMETGGILAGQQIGNSFEVTHLIIPEQIAANDRWEVQDVRQITNYFVYHDMIMLGLIHTHPQMTSFLPTHSLGLRKR